MDALALAVHHYDFWQCVDDDNDDGDGDDGDANDHCGGGDGDCSGDDGGGDNDHVDDLYYPKMRHLDCAVYRL